MCVNHLPDLLESGVFCLSSLVTILPLVFSRLIMSSISFSKLPGSGFFRFGLHFLSIPLLSAIASLLRWRKYRQRQAKYKKPTLSKIGGHLNYTLTGKLTD